MNRAVFKVFHECHRFNIWNILAGINIFHPTMKPSVSLSSEIFHFFLFFWSSIWVKLETP